MTARSLLQALPDGAGCVVSWARRGAGPSDVQQTWAYDAADLAVPLSDRVLVWAGSLVSGAKVDKAGEGLGLEPAELARASAFRRVEDAIGYVAAHGWLRWALGELTGVEPARLRFQNEPNGKPNLSDPIGDGWQFSISHSGPFAAVILSDQPVGVDIERVRPRMDLPGVARDKFPLEHQAALDRCDGDAWNALFFHYWTLSEALIKTTGLGLRQSLDSFAFSDQTLPKLLRLDAEYGPTENWRFGSRRGVG